MPEVPRSSIYGGIEGGGTKFVCAVGRGPSAILHRVSIPTRDPTTTLADCIQFFKAAEREFGPLAGLGLACFGPLELRLESERFGTMLTTPKAGWSGADLLAPFRAEFEVPVACEIDVGAAALAEWQLGAGRGLNSLAYVTVGTGIGGAMVPTNMAHRLMHAEMGHLRVRRDHRDASFAGVCPFHGDCLEGLASGPAIQARWGSTLDALPADHEAFAVVGGYLGQLAAAIALLLSAERVVFGGGVMANAALVSRIRAAARECLNDYLEPLRDAGRADAYICAPALGNDAGVVGALLLAQRAVHGNRT